jgi:DNA-binding MarR family transcriptional regulator
MTDPRTANLVGALVLALGDDLEAATTTGAGHGAAFPAAIVTMGSNPGWTIERLRRALGLSHSGTVRLLDRLEAEGIVERRAGQDGRSVALSLTAAGRRSYGRILQARRAAMSSALASLSAVERGQLIRITEKLLRGMTRDLEHSDHICRLCEDDVCPQGTCPVNCAALERSGATT